MESARPKEVVMYPATSELTPSEVLGSGVNSSKVDLDGHDGSVSTSNDGFLMQNALSKNSRPPTSIGPKTIIPSKIDSIMSSRVGVGSPSIKTSSFMPASSRKNPVKHHVKAFWSSYMDSALYLSNWWMSPYLE
ncbi:hypothetical protein F0562_012320 [Nyssa sinensis]|uniref:Uncharacterized protein n=1 Tax=Nyssa sinensis TaxID=561372 RepID=A0A5J4ZTJ0_9ASTE|nr:hypothetical protein F0562_012320 [Nyssa sinensis]